VTPPAPLSLGICSFAFHRSVASGAMDVAAIFATCRELGCTQLDPWNAHLCEPAAAPDGLHAGKHPEDARLQVPGWDHVERIRSLGARTGLPFGCIAVDGAHLFEADPAARELNFARACRWIEIAARLGASSVRIDAGGPERLDAQALAVIVPGYAALISRARALGVTVLVENHWGPTVVPDNVLTLLGAVPGLGFLFDTHNWKAGLQAEGWRRCAARATVVHVKTFAFDDAGEEATVDLRPAFAALRQARFQGTWCVESVPTDGDEVGAARATISLIRRHAQEAA